MNLFEVGPDFKVLLNKEWILLVPPFKKLVSRDRGSDGDSDGRKKFKAIKEFTYIYHLVDPRSPIESLQPYEREQKALQYAELTEKNIDAAVLEALSEYEVLLEDVSPSIALLRAAKDANSKLIEHFNTIDFNQTDKQGKLLHSATSHIKNVTMLKQLHTAIAEFEKIVHDELKDQKGVRCKTELGDREEGKATRRKWDEKNARKRTKEPEPESDDFEMVSDVFAVKSKPNKITGRSFLDITDITTKMDNEEDGIS